MGTLFDVTEQKRQEARLRELEIALDEVPTPIISIDRAGTITYVNNQAASVLGCDRDKIVGDQIAGLLKLRNSEVSIPELLLSQQNKHWSGNVCLTAFDGQTFDFAAHAVFRRSDEVSDHHATLYLMDLKKQKH